MTNAVKQAIEVLQGLPEVERERAAQVIIEYGASQDEKWQLTDEQVAEVERRLSQPKQKHMSLNEVRKSLRRFGV